LKGRYGRLEKLRPDHWSDLWVVFARHDHVWTYIPPDGPFAGSADFAAFIAKRAAADDPYGYAIIDAQDRAVGYFTLLRIVPPHRVIEVGHVLYSPALRNRDDVWFSMLDSEWPTRKRNFERWLSPDNFDAQGIQKVSLAALNGAAGEQE
jgi:RimJ/RimL family protein N-acetyltransferase